ncbi:hypothetical protein VB773_01215 [Haloarculaceae archaeon H-GB2-1]|nr:hypothetical protein [Haloarculaceae archaeon H-GB2-1]
MLGRPSSARRLGHLERVERRRLWVDVGDEAHRHDVAGETERRESDDADDDAGESEIDDDPVATADVTRTRTAKYSENRTYLASPVASA